MKRALFLTNVLLSVGIVVAISVFHERGADARTRQTGLAHKRAARLSSQAALPPAPSPVSPKAYAADAVQRFLFSPDRNSNVVETVTAPPPPMPPLPAVYGLLSFDGHRTIILGTSPSSQRAYHAGEQAGAFKLIRFDSRSVAFEWNGKEVERPLGELTARQNAAAILPASPEAASPLSSSPRAASPDGPMGPALGPTQHACISGDNVPAGTVASGFTKVVTKTPFGEICRWMK